MNAADATLATDNFKAGELLGEWTRAALGEAADSAMIATLDLAITQPSVDYLRHNGFLTGLGIEVPDQTRFSESDSERIAGSDVTGGSEEGGRTAMENILQRADQIDVVYSINELAATGADAALKAAGRRDGVLNVTISGGNCQDIRSIEDGTFAAVTVQYPARMAVMGTETLHELINSGNSPQDSTDERFIDTGTGLITNSPVAGLESIT